MGEQDAAPAARRQPPRALRPFRDAQYRRLVAALLLSLFGSGVWLVVLVWQVIELGGGPVDLSVAATANAVGMVCSVLIGGTLADRVPQKYILVGVEATKATVMATGAVLALTGALQFWHVVSMSLVYGITEGFFFPAYSAWLPSLLPPDQLLAANGVEGVLRPSILQAAGPAVAGGIIAAFSPGVGFAVIAVSQALAVTVLASMARTPVRRDLPADRGGALRSALRDVVEGFRYLVRTRWLLVTLVYSCLLILVVMGPIEVLLPFAVREQTGGGAGAFALVLAFFGIGGAVGSLVVASLRLPRRYLTLMNLLWGFGCLPMVMLGFTDRLWLMAAVMFVVGFCFQAGTVLWGTLLQRRVPAALLGRVSSLDFFVSLALMPVSMAVAGPVGELVGIPVAFVVAATVPTVLAVVAAFGFGLTRDEIAHPLEQVPERAVA